MDLILLHGALGTGEELRPISEALPPLFKSHLFTFHGHGGKHRHWPFSIAGFADEVAEYLISQNIKQALVFGYSMGGYVALKLAMKNPALLRGIITLGTRFDWNPAFTTAETAKLNARILEEKAPAFAEHLKRLHGEQWLTLLNNTASMMKAIEQGSVEFVEMLPHVNLPVWITRGDQDRMVSLNESLMVANSIKDARYFELRESGHRLESLKLPELLKVFSEVQKVLD